VTTLDALKLRLGIIDSDADVRLNSYLDAARDFMMMFTGRNALPEALDAALVRIAVILYQRRRHRSSAPIGDVSMLLPDDLYRTLCEWRVSETRHIHRRG
jgi:hypothetical protein